MAKNLARNLEYLMERKGLTSQMMVQRATSVSQTHVGNILKLRKMPGMGVLDRLAKGFGLETWQLLAPLELLKRGLDENFTSLLESYLSANDKGRQTILDVAKAQAQFDQPLLPSDP